MARYGERWAKVGRDGGTGKRRGKEEWERKWPAAWA